MEDTIHSSFVGDLNNGGHESFSVCEIDAHRSNRDGHDTEDDEYQVVREAE